MKNNVIELYNYCDTNAFDYTAYNRRAQARFRRNQIRYWLFTIVDTVATISITGCTLFCCYLAFTML